MEGGAKEQLPETTAALSSDSTDTGPYWSTDRTSANSPEESGDQPNEESSMEIKCKPETSNDISEENVRMARDIISQSSQRIDDEKVDQIVTSVIATPSPVSSDDTDECLGLENKQECVPVGPSQDLIDHHLPENLPLSDISNTANNDHVCDISGENQESAQRKNPLQLAECILTDKAEYSGTMKDCNDEKRCETTLASGMTLRKCGKQLSAHPVSHVADNEVDITFEVQSTSKGVDLVEIPQTRSGRPYGSPGCSVPGVSGKANRAGRYVWQCTFPGASSGSGVCGNKLLHQPKVQPRCAPGHQADNQRSRGHGKGFSVITPSTSICGNDRHGEDARPEEDDPSSVMYPIEAYADKLEVSFPKKRRNDRDRVGFEVWIRPMEIDHMEKVSSEYPYDAVVLENLQPATSYEVIVVKLVNGEEVSRMKQHASTMPFSHPADFAVRRGAEGMVHFEWHAPQIIAPSHPVEGYTITVCNYLECNVPQEEKHRYDGITRAAVLELDKDLSYVFCIEATSSDYVSKPSKANILMPKHKMLKQGDKMETKGKPIYLLNLTNTTVGPGKICRKELGELPIPGLLQKEKVVLIVGATGSGKTTWINAIVNYILDVKYTDNFRFKLVVDENADNQSISQTRHITIYTIHHQDGFKIDYTLTIIDTPGFGDTRGIQKDKEIEVQLREIFDPSNGCVDHLDAVGFVAPASSARLTPTQKYIFTSILSLFGVDIGENIYMLFTFADGKPPQMMSAIKAAKVPYQECFKFNNSAVFDDIGQAEGVEEFEMDDESEHFNRMFWDLGMKSFERFVSKVFLSRPMSLTLTRVVLSERERIEMNVENLNTQVRLGLSKMDQLRIEENLLKKFEDDIESNKDYTYEIKRLEVKKIPIPDGRNTTTCLMCNFTCHQQCIYANDSEKAMCWAMDQEECPQTCTQCPNRCVWDIHRNICYILEQHMVTEISTLADIKSRYEEASGNKLTAEQVFRKVQEDLEAIEAEIKADLSEISESLQKLHHIALKNNPMSQIEYLDILIESERSEANPGWQERVRGLQDLRQQAQNIYDIHQGEYDPFKAYREEAIRARQEGCDMRHVSTWVTVSNRVKNAVGKVGALFGLGSRTRKKWL